MGTCLENTNYYTLVQVQCWLLCRSPSRSTICRERQDFKFQIQQESQPNIELGDEYEHISLYCSPATSAELCGANHRQRAKTASAAEQRQTEQQQQQQHEQELRTAVCCPLSAVRVRGISSLIFLQ